MNATVGIASYGTYDSGTLGDKVDSLLALIPDPDAAHGTGAAANSGAGAGFLDEMSPAAAVQLRVELAALAAGIDAGGDDVAYGQHTVTAGEATANQADIVTGLADTTVANIAVTVSRAGAIATGDAVITEPSAGTIRVASGASTYDMTAGDIITWFARDPSA